MAYADYLIQCEDEEEVNERMVRFETWWEELVEHGIHEKIDFGSTVFHAKKIWCPILDKKTGSCSTYDMRPVVCRTHHSINVADCDDWKTPDSEGLAALRTDDLLSAPVTEIGMGMNADVSYWQFWVGKHLGCSFADAKPPLLAEDD